MSLKCPAGLEVLLHYHCRCEPLHPSPINDEYTALLLAEGLIHPVEGYSVPYHTTERGRAMVEALCRTPFPEERVFYVDPRNNELLRGE